MALMTLNYCEVYPLANLLFSLPKTRKAANCQPQSGRPDPEPQNDA